MMRLPFGALLALALAAPLCRGQFVQMSRLEDPAPALDLCFGHSVDISGDLAVVGVPKDDAGGTNAGSAHVFRRSGGNWLHEQEIRSSAGGDQLGFGSCVATDGSRVVVSAVGPASFPPMRGEVFIFERIAGQWWQVADIDGPPLEGAEFGRSLSILGNRIAVGAPNESATWPGAGAVHILERIGSIWTDTATVTAPTPVQFADFGYSLDLGFNVLAVGAPNQPAPGGGQGGAFVYRWNGSSWAHEDSPLPNQPLPNSRFGNAVDLFGDDLLVGAPTATVGGLRSGVALLFQKQGTSWSEAARLTSAAPFDDHLFGAQVGIHLGRALVSSPGAYNESGILERFGRVGTTFAPGQIYSPPTVQEGDRFGDAAALDGTHAIAGVPSEAGPLANSGVAYVLVDRAPLVKPYCTAQTSSSGCVPTLSTLGYPSATAFEPFEIHAGELEKQKPAIFFYGTTGRAALPFSGGLLCSLPPRRRTPPQITTGLPPQPPCAGTLVFDAKTWIQSGVDPALVPGSRLYGQFWSRDPGSPSGTNLTSALEIVIHQ